MPTVAVIPIRSFRVGKQRLGGVLDESARARLGRALAERVGSAVADIGLLPLFVTADPEVAEWAITEGFPSITDTGAGLDSAAADGATWAEASGSRWLVLHSDLPLLTTTDLGSLDAAISAGHNLIAPSSDGGTSALSARTTIDFAYGTGSFHRHLSKLDDPRVITATGLLHDLDSTSDLRSASQHARGQWIKGVLA